MTRTFRSYHEYIDVFTRYDFTKVNVKAMSECQVRTLFQVWSDILCIYVCLQFVWNQYHNDISAFNGFWQSRWENFYPDLKRLNVMGGEMETSIVLVLTRIWGLRGGAMAVTLDNIIDSQEDEGEYEPEQALDHSEDNIKTLSLMGCETIKKLYEMDQAAGK